MRQRAKQNQPDLFRPPERSLLHNDSDEIDVNESCDRYTERVKNAFREKMIQNEIHLHAVPCMKDSDRVVYH